MKMRGRDIYPREPTSGFHGASPASAASKQATVQSELQASESLDDCP